MKKYNGVPVWIVITVVLIALGVSVWALIIAYSQPNSFFRYNFDYTKLVELTGLLFTVIGAVFAFYFVIIGIDASRKKTELEKIENEIKEKQAKIESLSRVELNHQNTLYEELINIVKNTIADESKRSRIVDALYLSKARLATQSKFLSKDIRLEDICRLEGIGEKTDIDDLQRIIDDPTEDEEIKELAKGIKPLIEKRLKK